MSTTGWSGLHCLKSFVSFFTTTTALNLNLIVSRSYSHNYNFDDTKKKKGKIGGKKKNYFPRVLPFAVRCVLTRDRAPTGLICVTTSFLYTLAPNTALTPASQKSRHRLSFLYYALTQLVCRYYCTYTWIPYRQAFTHVGFHGWHPFFFFSFYHFKNANQLFNITQRHDVVV